MPEGEASEAGHEEPQESQALRCDFCGAEVPRVRRVALDRDYERLQSRHQALYACEQCSEEKELRRLGLRRA